MKLHDNQLRLIRHLIRFNILDYENCLKVLSTQNEKDEIALSYAFRPLTKNNYIAKNKDNIVTALNKGKNLFPDEKQLISDGGNEQTRKRILQVSKTAALMENCGIIISGELPDNRKPTFIPSACWRNIAHGILSTTRFTGMLIGYSKKYAVYDIGDGCIEWQVRAESSLFYSKYGDYETKADGMILICDDGKRNVIAENIIRQTMWNRKTLLNTEYTERKKPVRFSRAPIKLRTQYEHVYLVEQSSVKEKLKLIYNEEYIIEHTIGNGRRLNDPKLGDIEIWPIRYFINPDFDLLKLVYFFSAVKLDNEMAKKSEHMLLNTQYTIVMHKNDLKILKMYPDVIGSKKVAIYEFGFN